MEGRVTATKGWRDSGRFVMACLLGIASLWTASKVWAQEDTVPRAGSPAAPSPSAIGPRSQLQQAQSSPLEDILLERGVITTDDWIRIKAEEEKRAQITSAEVGMLSSPRWYERIRVSGYIQNRYSLLDNTMMDIPLGDRVATTDPNTFYIRRIRVVFQGQISDRLAFYFQPAYEGNQQALSNLEIVDAFGDFFITKDKQHRFRFGQHRTPNAFDTYRSSSNRQELDRHESVQSGAPGERDLGLAYYWSPKISQQRYAQLATYHNGPGDYGDFGIMVWNGQGRNRAELNSDKHIGVRLAHPFELPNGRLVETGLFAYRGIFTVSLPGTNAVSRCPLDLRQDGSANNCRVLDERITGYIWTPPQPWGLLAEYTLGRGPQRDSDGFIRESALYGGYVQPYYTWRYSDVGQLTGYFRWGEYYGGFKNIQGVDGRSKTINVGLVWEPDTHWRFVAEWMYKEGLHSSLVSSSPNVALTNTAPQSEFTGNLFRLQAQWFFN